MGKPWKTHKILQNLYVLLDLIACWTEGKVQSMSKLIPNQCCLSPRMARKCWPHRFQPVVFSSPRKGENHNHCDSGFYGYSK